jgi:alpha-glucosidase
MAPSLRTIAGTGFISRLLGPVLVYGQSQSGTPTTASVLTATIAGEVVTYSPQFTVPASADQGVNVLPNVLDPQAVDAQTVCPGYNASDVVNGTNGFSTTLTLAGEPCKYVFI